MAFIDKLKDELDRAGRAAQDALDEGKTRLEAFRTRQLADKAAQALGYAVFRARQSGGEIDADSYTRLAATLATHDSEASKYERDLDRKRTEGRKSATADTPPPAAEPPPAASTPPDGPTTESESATAP